MRLLARLLIFLVSSSALICAVVAQEDSLKPTLISVNSDFGLRFHPSNDSSKNVRHLTSLVGHAQIMAGPSYISCQSSIVNSFSGTALPLVWTCSDSGYGDNEDSTIRLFGPGKLTFTRFGTEAKHDYIQYGTTTAYRYSGSSSSSAPIEVDIPSGSVLDVYWHTDSSQSNSGGSSTSYTGFTFQFIAIEGGMRCGETGNNRICDYGTYCKRTTTRSCFFTCSDVVTFSCEPCIAGSHNDVFNSAEATSCKLCGLGKYTNTPGRQNCADCQQGRYSADFGRSSPCLDTCPKGTYGDGTGYFSAEQCALCDENTYNPFPGGTSASDCLSCAAPKTSPPGSSSCSSCGPGAYSPASGACFDCERGSYCRQGGIVKCPSGYYNDQTGSADPSDCKPCSEGRYSSLQGIPYLEDCILCPRGTASSTEGRTTPCNDCNTGFFQASGGASKCAACPLGKTSPSFGPQVSCSVCAAGKYLNSTTKLCDVCPVGTFSQGVETTSNATQCNVCPKGRFAAEKGSVECTACRAGRYNDKEASTSQAACTPCPSGTYSTAEPSTSDASCVKCPSGFFNDKDGANAESACKACPKGTAAPRAGASSRSDCINCAQGEYQDNVGQSECKKCPRGKYGREQNAGNSSSLFPSPSPSSVPSQSPAPTPPSAVNKSTSPSTPPSPSLSPPPSPAAGPSPSGVNASSPTPSQLRSFRISAKAGCDNCPTGTYSAYEGLSNKNNCIQCAAGRQSFVAGAVDSSVCTDCPAGKQRNFEDSSCKECAPGSFAEKPGMKDCLRVPDQTYSEGGWNFTRKCPTTVIPGQGEIVHCDPTTRELNISAGFYCMHECSRMDERTLIVKCNNDKACGEPVVTYNPTTGTFDYTAVCNNGYDGPECRTCKKYYGRAGLPRSYTCQACPDLGLNFALLSLFMVGLSLLVLYVVIRKTKKNKASLTRIILTFIQFQSYASFLATDWPNGVELMYQVQEVVTTATPQFISIDCLLAPLVEGSKTVSSLFQLWLTTMVLPLFVIFVIFVVYVCLHVRHWIKHDDGLFSPQRLGSSLRGFIRTVIIVEWLMWSTILKESMSLFQCRTYGTGGSALSLLQLDLEVPCTSETAIAVDAMNGDRNSTQRYGWYVQYSNMNYIVIGLHLFAFPLFLVYVLLANRSLYVDPSSKSPAALENFYETYGFMLAGYRPNMAHWEILVLTRRFLVILCVVFLEDHRQVQLATVFFIALVSLYLHLYYKPYDIPRLPGLKREILERGMAADRLERWSLCTLLVTLLSGFYFLDKDLNLTVKQFLGFVVVGLNVTFVIVFFYEYAQSKLSRFGSIFGGDRKGGECEKESNSKKRFKGYVKSSRRNGGGARATLEGVELTTMNSSRRGDGGKISLYQNPNVAKLRKLEGKSSARRAESKGLLGLAVSAASSIWTSSDDEDNLHDDSEDEKEEAGTWEKFIDPNSGRPYCWFLSLLLRCLRRHLFWTINHYLTATRKHGYVHKFILQGQTLCSDGRHGHPNRRRKMARERRRAGREKY